MARPLRETPPTSAVARLLDVGAAARAVAVTAVMAPETPSAPHAALPQPAQETCDAAPVALVKREFVLTPQSEQVLSDLMDLFRRHTGAKLTGSHLLRSLLMGLESARGTLEPEVRRLGPLKLPSNARDRQSERSRFERRIAAALVAGMRAAAAFDPDS